ncbi:hypothetical protein OG594_32295 [Streptomyces sp. NBC_01214]|uniref:hypothetical protein n=1 Tax=Streptomyces sp. NBC_01214 TaxID=2903777 RepID=UPI00224E8CD4|nr:hypothetical protein [Streptomyces sp. NBC_01214]MCX4806246.1 hypothetical protein [Streptomyces sp. NBC_01214]
MTRTTPPRPVDAEALFPALADYRRTSTRLHPRHGSPKANDSSVAGPFLWPADEPWPVCTAVHPKGRGHRLSDVRLQRRILDEAWHRDPRSGPTDAEREVLDSLQPGPCAPQIGDADPIPLLAVAQLFARDVPDLTGPEGCDLLQVLWCPFEVHGPDRTIDVVLKWRRSQDVHDVLAVVPEPAAVGRAECVPNTCVLHPERVVEHEYEGLLDEELQEAIETWEVGDDEEDDDAFDSCAPSSFDTYEEYEAAMAVARADEDDEVTYRGDLSIAPGWKVGGFASWHLTDPAHIACGVCGAPMPPLLTVAVSEWDGASESWIPLEDQDSLPDSRISDPTGVYLGRGLMRVHTCPATPTHPHRLSFQ